MRTVQENATNVGARSRHCISLARETPTGRTTRPMLRPVGVSLASEIQCRLLARTVSRFLPRVTLTLAAALVSSSMAVAETGARQSATRHAHCSRARGKQ